MINIDLNSSIQKNFLNNGFIVSDIKEIEKLNLISKKFYDYSLDLLENKFNVTSDSLSFFNNIHNQLKIEALNDFRLNLINKINSDKEIKNNLYSVAKIFLDELVGNELAIQRRLNLSIQYPNDDSSLLPIHADTWSGDSPYEIVVWLPLVDCFKTKSMYILPPKFANEINKSFNEKLNISANDLYYEIKDNVKWIDIKYGQIMLFNQSLPHGNVVNEENETRWSINCRFKGLFTPYGDKKLGEFFEPLSTKLMTKIGMNYKYPNTK